MGNESVPDYMNSEEIKSLERAAESCEERGQYRNASLHYKQICDILVNKYNDPENADYYCKKARECLEAIS